MLWIHDLTITHSLHEKVIVYHKKILKVEVNQLVLEKISNLISFKCRYINGILHNNYFLDLYGLIDPQNGSAANTWATQCSFTQITHEPLFPNHSLVFSVKMINLFYFCLKFIYTTVKSEIENNTPLKQFILQNWPKIKLNV